MSFSKTQKKQKPIGEVVNDFESIFDSSTDEEDLEFEGMAINSDFMDVIAQLMAQHGIKSRAELAARLGVSPAYVSMLFSGDKTFNAKLLAKFQRLFNTKFTFSARSLQKSKT